MNPIYMAKSLNHTGEKGAEKIFKISLMVNAGKITEKEMRMVMVDSTVHNKDISFPMQNNDGGSSRRRCGSTGII